MQCTQLFVDKKLPFNLAHEKWFYVVRKRACPGQHGILGLFVVDS